MVARTRLNVTSHVLWVACLVETLCNWTVLDLSVEISWIESSSDIGRSKGDYGAYLSFIRPLSAYFSNIELANYTDSVQPNNWKVLCWLTIVWLMVCGASNKFQDPSESRTLINSILYPSIFPYWHLSDTHSRELTVGLFFFTNLMHKFFILIHLLHSSTCFEYYCAHLQEDNCISTGSGIVTVFRWLFSTQVAWGLQSLSLGDCSVHRLREDCSHCL